MQGMQKADTARAKLIETLSKSTITYEDTAAAALEYVPAVNQVLWTCKMQPDAARLDERLQFEWKSGIETSRTASSFLSEALMYELVMTVACAALATGGAGCDSSVSGDFAAAGKQFKVAAGIWQYLGQDLMPKWIARGSDALQKDLPIEASTGVADAMTQLNLAFAQQMIVSAALKNNTKTSYSLMAKLTLGISELIDDAVKVFNRKASEQKARMDPECFTLLKFTLEYHSFLSMYFTARATWEDNHEYGMAIAMMKEADAILRRNLPDVDSVKSPLRVLGKDMAAVRTHIMTVLQSWDKDNSSVYFESIPTQIPLSKKLTTGMKMIKEPQPFVVEDPAILPLSIPPERPPPIAPPATIQRSDSDLARELQAKFNSGIYD